MPAVRTAPPDTRRDLLGLAALIALSLVPHVGELGFYSDDWPHLGRFSLSADQSIAGLFRAGGYAETYMRPGQVVYYAALYRIFGLHPLGYHVVNAAVIVVTGLMFYRVLRQLDQSRSVSLAVPLLYAVLPHYSTARVWYASFQAALSVLLYLVSLFAGLRSLRTPGRGGLVWGGLSLFALLGSGLCYEAAVPLFLLNAALFTWKGGRTFPVLTLGGLGAVIGFKLLKSNRLAPGLTRAAVTNLVKQSVRINGWVYGLAAPRTVWRAGIAVPRVDLVVGALLLAGTFWALRGTADPPGQRSGGAAAARLVVWGLVITLLGHVVFLASNDVAFSATGNANRIAIAWAAGIALMVVGFTAWLVTRVKPSTQARAFAAAVAVFVAAAFVTSASLTSWWVAAYREELRVLATISQAFPTLPTGTTLLLDGECPYIGPGIVFESSWDLRGALWLIYRDSTLRADVVAPRLQVTREGVHGFAAIYPYDRLIIFDVRRRAADPIPDAAAAEAYFARFNPDRSSGCPPGRPGEGVRPF